MQMTSSSKSSDDASTEAASASQAVAVQYYAQLREEAGRSEEVVQSDADTVAGLFRELGRRHDFSVSREDLRVAVNGSFAGWDTRLSPEDLVVFIPPVAGG